VRNSHTPRDQHAISGDILGAEMASLEGFPGIEKLLGVQDVRFDHVGIANAQLLIIIIVMHTQILNRNRTIISEVISMSTFPDRKVHVITPQACIREPMHPCAPLSI